MAGEQNAYDARAFDQKMQEVYVVNILSHDDYYMQGLGPRGEVPRQKRGDGCYFLI